MSRIFKIISVILLLAILVIASKNALKHYTLSNIYFKNQLLSKTQAKQLLKLIDKVEFYQPLYEVDFPSVYTFFNPIKRDDTSKERAKLIHEYLKSDIRYKKLNILDVGSSLGYMPLYFGNLNNRVLGIDSNSNNIAVSEFLAQLNNNPDISFKSSSFDDEFVKNMPYHYDVTFIFSVLHHIIREKGIDFVQDLMVNLLDKSPILFVELAIKEEKVDFPWRSSLPDNPLDIFSKCKNLSIEKIGEFKTHLSDVKRPLYVVKKQSITVNNQSYDYNSMNLRGYNHNDPDGMDTRTRRYYASDEYYIKEIVATDDTAKNEAKQLTSFFQNNKLLISAIPTPKLIDWEQTDNRFIFIFEKIKGAKLLADQLRNLDSKQKIDIAKQTINIMSIMEQSGVYHNDIRTWNLMLKENQDNTFKVFVIDFDMASNNKTEDPLESLLWLMYDLNYETLEEVNHTKNMFLTPISDYGIFSDIASVIINKKVNSSKELLDFIEHNEK